MAKKITAQKIFQGGINALLFVTFFFFSLGSLGRLAPFSNEVFVYVYEILVAVTLLILFAVYRFQPFQSISKAIKPFFFFLAYLFINYFFLIYKFSARDNVIGFLYFIRLSLYVFYGLYLHYYFQKVKQPLEVKLGFALFLVITVISALVQYFLYPDLRNLSYLEWDPHLYRMFGLFFDPFLSAAVYGMLAIYLYFSKEKILQLPWVKWPLELLFLAMFFLTYSRGAYVALLASLVIFVIAKKKYILIAAIFVLFLGGIFLLPKKTGEGMNLLRTSTIVTRLEDYKTGIEVWRRQPIIGVGYNRIRYEKVELHEDGEVSIMKSHAGASFHSSFLIILAASGIFGLGLFIYALISLMKVSPLLFYSTIFLAVFSLTDNVILHPVVLFLYFMYFAWEISPSYT